MADIPIPQAPSQAQRASKTAAASDGPHAARRRSPSLRPAFPRSFSLSASDRAVLGLYVLTRIGVWITAYCTAWLFTSDPDAKHAPSFLSLWDRWDWDFFRRIAEHGYFGGDGAVGSARPDNREAFFPGLSLTLRAVHFVVPSWTLAGLLISFAAGAVAVSALARIARLHFPQEQVGPRAALFLLVSPCAVFLAAGYTESLFLACALPAWLAAKRGNWPLAATLAALATSVRISGLFLAAALVVQFLVSRQPGFAPKGAASGACSRRAGRKARTGRTWTYLGFRPVRRRGYLPARAKPRAWGRVPGVATGQTPAGAAPAIDRERGPWRSAPWLALPAVPALAYAWYLKAGTGDWMAWQHAQERGWYRQFHTPWEAWRNTWDGAFGHAQTTGHAAMFQAELLAMVIGVLLLAVLVARRQWPEAVYIALNLWALGTSYWYMSVPRASLLWWPLWISLAVWSMRRPWLKYAYLCVAAPLMTVLTLVFTSGRWAG